MNKNDLDDILLDINNGINNGINNDINNDKNKKNFVKDTKILKLQENLLMMGFDINMINKVIMYFNINTENEAIDYLVKTDDGMWNHPFIESTEKFTNSNEDTSNNNNILDNVINKMKTFNNDLPNQDICEICGERKELHIYKDINDENNNNNYNNEYIGVNDLEDNNLLNYNNLEGNNNESNKDNENNNNICQICLDTINNPVEIEKCKHKFCYDCFQNYLNNLINENNIENIPCPEVKCNNKTLSIDFFSNYITEEQLIKYQNFKTQNEIARDKLKIFCPLCNSYAKIDNPDNYNPNNLLYKKSKLKCLKGHEFCSCGRPEHEGECYHEGEEFQNLVNKEKIKKCPKCGFLIKKNSGCNHMICGNKACKFEFCWLCLKESLPGHYEQGECEGKQFVDTDSIFYQLEQKYPFLFYVFCFFKFLLIIICFLISVCFPALPLWIFLAIILYFNFNMEDDDEDKLFILPKYLSILHFVISFPIILSVQTIYYMGLALSLVGISLYIVFYIFNTIYLLICLCIYCCCSK